jgi:uncharacterized phage-associated protein
MYLLKMMFFADRYHIRHFGFVASGDNYIAMKNGPVASATYDILLKKMPHQANLAEKALLEDILVVSEYEVEIAKQEIDELSESFMQSLDFAIETYGNYEEFELSDITHDYPEWKKHEATIKQEVVKRVPMDFKDFFDNPLDLECSKKQGIKTDPFADDKDFLQTLKDDFDEDKGSC